MMRLLREISAKKHRMHGSVCIEYLLLLTIVGIGVICGLAVLKDALIGELYELAAAITAISFGP